MGGMTRLIEVHGNQRSQVKSAEIVRNTAGRLDYSKNHDRFLKNSYYRDGRGPSDSYSCFPCKQLDLCKWLLKYYRRAH